MAPQHILRPRLFASLDTTAGDSAQYTVSNVLGAGPCTDGLLRCPYPCPPYRRVRLLFRCYQWRDHSDACSMLTFCLCLSIGFSMLPLARQTSLGLLISQLDGMVRMWHECDCTFDESVGLHYYTPNFDAQEYTLPGFMVTHSVNNQLELHGPNTYRPRHNAYMGTNAKAIAAAAQVQGNTTIAAEFTNLAMNLENVCISTSKRLTR